jgi:hypothetical protein
MKGYITKGDKRTGRLEVERKVFYIYKFRIFFQQKSQEKRLTQTIDISSFSCIAGKCGLLNEFHDTHVFFVHYFFLLFLKVNF